MKEINIEELRKLYTEEGKSRNEVAEYFGVKPYVISNLVSIHGLQKPGQEEAFQNILKKYTREEISMMYADHSHKEMANLLGTTGDVLNMVLKYYDLGKRRTVQRFEEQVSEEELRRLYLEDNYSLKELAKKFNVHGLTLYKTFQKYGILKPKDKVAENIKKTLQEKYGVNNPNDIPGVPEKREQTCQDRYGAKCVLISKHCYSKFKNDSKPNQEFAKILKDRGIEFEREFPVGDRAFDFRVDKTLVEINPYATHNSTWGIDGKEGKDKLYHKEKSDLAAQNGYSCLHVWDWDDREKILELLQPRTPVYARKCKLRVIEQKDANVFLKRYHLQNGAKMQKVCLGLFYEGDLVEVMTFGPPRFNKNFEWELIRLCTKTGIRVLGGSQKLWKHFVEEYKPKSVISYCDRSKFSGKIYGDLGFTLRSAGMPSRHWYSPELKQHITDNGLRLRGFDLLMGKTYGTYGKGTVNDDLMREHGFVEIWDAGQAVWIWNSSKE